MIKAIFARDIQAKDVIDLNDKTRITVRGTLTGEHVEEAEVFIHVFAEPSGRQFLLRPGSIVGLVYRPYQEGKTEKHLSSEIAKRAYDIAVGKWWDSHPNLKQEDIVNLREAIEAWEAIREYVHQAP